MARSKLIQLFNRIIKVQDRKDKIYVNGSDNLYPERIERLIKNSVTAKLSADKLISFLVGYGFGEQTNDIILNPKKKLSAYTLLDRSAKDVGYQKGVYFHVNFDVEGKPNYLDVLKFKNCRISEEDDHDNKGYVWYSKIWEGGVLSFNREKHTNWFYPYNPDLTIINRQRKADWKIANGNKEATPEDLIKNYRGQVFFLNLDDDSVYPDSLIDPAYNDADTEHRISVFRNDRVKSGFIGANIIITPPSDNEKEAGVTDDDLKSLLGAENASNILRLEVAPDGDRKLSDYIHVETIKSDVDTEQFQYDEKKVQENIMACFYGIPEILVKSSDGALFGPNGDTLKVAQEIYQRNTEMPRNKLQRAFEMIYKDSGIDFTIDPLIDVPEDTVEPIVEPKDDENVDDN